MTESHGREIELLEDKIRRTEKELNRANDQLHFDSHSKWGNQFLNEKKFNDMVENERRLMNELKDLKEENEQ